MANGLEKELADAQEYFDAYMVRVREHCQLEINDMVRAIELAVVEGEGSRHKLSDTSGNPLPEQWAFDLSLMIRDFLRAWLRSLMETALKGR